MTGRRAVLVIHMSKNIYKWQLLKLYQKWHIVMFFHILRYLNLATVISNT